MNRRGFLLAVAASLATGGAAWGASFTDQIVAQLRTQGYRQIKVTRTLLGRVRITAVSSRHRREIIFNPRSGEILRDYWESLKDGNDQGDTLFDPENSGGGSDGGSGEDGSDDGGDDGSDDGKDDSEDDSSNDHETEDRDTEDHGTEHESEDDGSDDDSEDD